MADRNVNESVVERRLKPIYEWLDNGNNKKAVQEADKVLRKQPKLHCATVLKALALLRLGRNDECSNLIQSVVSEGTADDATLQALTIYFREVHQLQMICSVYEKAAKLDPSNEEIMSHLFMAHVRVGDYKKQQQTAMQLYKLKPKNPYYFWGIMSIVMQAHVTEDIVATKVILQLAERMILKFVNENKIESEAEVLTYLYILEIQEKYAEALSVIDGPLTKKILQQPHNFVSLKRSSYHSHLGHYEAASIIYMNLILHEPDNWQHYVNFVDTIMSMWKNNASLPEGSKADPLQEASLPEGSKADPLQEASQFLKEVEAKALKDSCLYRSPLLGLLQFSLKLKEHTLENKIEDLCGKPSHLLHQYMENFGDKMCCFTDLVNFLTLVTSDEASKFLGKVKDLAQMDENDVPTDIKNIYRHQIYLQLRHYFRDFIRGKSDFQTEIESADLLVSFYLKTASFSADMAPTDIRPNDTYLIMAAHVYLSVILNMVKKNPVVDGNSDISPKAADDSQLASKLLIKLCALLEHGSDVSNANFQLKLLLIKAYNMVGAIEQSYCVYERLDLKQIQLDTLGYVLSLQLMDYGSYANATTVFNSTLRFFMANFKDTSDPLIMSYKFGSLVRIPEFIEFRDRLNKSLHFALITLELMVLEFTTRANSRSELESLMQDIDPYKDKAVSDKLRDNRDLTVMNSWEPTHGRIDELIKDSTFADDVAFLNIRSTVLRLIGAAFNLRKDHRKNNDINESSTKRIIENGESNGYDDAPIYIYKELVQELQSHAINCDKYRKSTHPQIPLQGPDLPRLYLYSQGGYFELILKHTQILLYISEHREGGEFHSDSSFVELTDLLNASFDLHSTHLDLVQVSAVSAVPGTNNQCLSRLSHFVQTMSLCIILAECLHCIIKPGKTNLAKKNKKKRSTIAAGMPNCISHYNNYLSTFVTRLETFDDCLATKLKELTSVQGDNFDIDVQSFSGLTIEECDRNWIDIDQKKIKENIERSLTESLIVFKSFFKSKIDFLNSMKI